MITLTVNENDSGTSGIQRMFTAGKNRLDPGAGLRGNKNISTRMFRYFNSSVSRSYIDNNNSLRIFFRENHESTNGKFIIVCGYHNGKLR